MSDRPSRFMDFLTELGRRRVFRTAALYTGLAIVVLEITEALVRPLGLPLETLPLVAWAAIFGFPICVGLAWTYDVTPAGIVRTPPGSDADRRKGRVSTGVGFRLTATGLAAVLVGAVTWILLEPLLPDVVEPRAVAAVPGTPRGSVLVTAVEGGEGVDAATAEQARLLLVRRLAEVAGMRPVDPRRAARARAAESEDVDGLARTLGAERILDATLAATADGLRLRAVLRPASGPAGSAEPLEATATGPAGTLPALVDSVVVTLAGADGG